MEIKFIEKDSFSIIGKSIVVTTKDENDKKEIVNFWSESCDNGLINNFMGEMGKLGVMGVCWNMDFEEQTFNYTIGIEEPESDLEGEYDIIDVPKTQWAIFKCVGAMPDAIQKGWKYIFEDWFPSVNYEHADGPELEIYYEGDPNSEDYISEIWIPIK